MYVALTEVSKKRDRTRDLRRSRHPEVRERRAFTALNADVVRIECSEGVLISHIVARVEDGIRAGIQP